MDALELIKLDGRKVRENSNLMSVYIETFFNTFGYKPNCAGCTFNNDFEKLRRAINAGNRPVQKHIIMEATKTFKLKKANGSILTYYVNKKPFRMYDNRLTEAFAEAFLTNGSKEQIQERKKLFSILPEMFQPKQKKEDTPVKEEVENKTLEQTETYTKTTTPITEEKAVTKPKKTRKPRTKKNSK